MPVPLGTDRGVASCCGAECGNCEDCTGGERDEAEVWWNG
jgi:hypothetical protein